MRKILKTGYEINSGKRSGIRVRAVLVIGLATVGTWICLGLAWTGPAIAQPAGGPAATPTAAWAGTSSGTMEEFMKLRDRLPHAICDEAMIAKAPSLGAVSEEKNHAPDEEFELLVKTSESTLISFLLGDASSLIATPQLKLLLESDRGVSRPAVERLLQARRKVSLDACTATVVPGKLKSLLEDKPDRVFTLLPRTRATHDAGTLVLVLHDAEGRFGRIRGRWFVAGWVEPYEVIRAQVLGREYFRLANPVTNQLQFILIQRMVRTTGGKISIPVGYLSPSAEQPAVTWAALKANAEKPESIARKFEVYRLLIEREAYLAVNRAPRKADAVRNIHEKYKKLLAAHQAERGKAGASTAKSADSGEGALRALLDDFFMKELQQATVNDGYISLTVFLPDSRLETIYREFHEQLAKL